MGVRKSAKRPISALFTFLLVTGTLTASGPDIIIPEWNASIQLIYMSSFENWPGVSGFPPIDVSAADGRIWLIWPESIINFNGGGYADEQTLLTVFATQTAVWGEGNWTAESGAVCSDGYWRGFIHPRESFAQMDMKTGEVRAVSWNEDIPDSIYPAVDGSLLVFSNGEANLVSFNSGTGELDLKRLNTGISPVSLLAVSSEHPHAAWKDNTGDNFHIADFSGSGRKITLEPGTLPKIPAWSLDWAGNMLILAYSGKLLALNIADDGTAEVSRLEDDRLPDRWYRIRGGKDQLVVHSPETGTVAIVRSGNSAADKQIGDPVEDFAALIERYTLSAGNLLEDSGRRREAEQFYAWILPFVRDFRSRHPLEELWPILEKDLTDRRSVLRNSLD